MSMYIIYYHTSTTSSTEYNRKNFLFNAQCDSNRKNLRRISKSRISTNKRDHIDSLFKHN